MQGGQRSWPAVAGLVYASGVWGTTFVIVKAALKGIDPLVLVGYRFLVSGTVLAAFPSVRRRNRPGDAAAGMVLGAWLWLLYVPQTLGLLFTPASNSGFITGLFVVFVPVFSRLFLKRAQSLPRYAAAGIATAGLWLVTGGIGRINAGDVLTLAGAMAYAAHLLCADGYLRSGRDPFVLSCRQLLVVGTVSLLLAAALRRPFSISSPEILGALGFLTFFATLSAFVAQLLAQKHLPPVKVSLILMLEPAFAAVFAWTVGREPLVWTKAAGGALILAAMAAADLPARMPEPDMYGQPRCSSTEGPKRVE